MQFRLLCRRSHVYLHVSEDCASGSACVQMLVVEAGDSDSDSSSDSASDSDSGGDAAAGEAEAQQRAERAVNEDAGGAAAAADVSASEERTGGGGPLPDAEESDFSSDSSEGEEGSSEEESESGSSAGDEEQEEGGGVAGAAASPSDAQPQSPAKPAWLFSPTAAPFVPRGAPAAPAAAPAGKRRRRGGPPPEGGAPPREKLGCELCGITCTSQARALPDSRLCNHRTSRRASSSGNRSIQPWRSVFSAYNRISLPFPQGDLDSHLASKGHKKKAAPPKPASERRPAKPRNLPPTFVGPDAIMRYGSQVISPELNRAAVELLRKLHEFQERTRVQEPLKAKAKRRLVFGLRQVQKALRTKKAKMVLFAPNIEEVEARAASKPHSLHAL